MRWKKIDPKNPPKGYVLVLTYDKDCFMTSMIFQTKDEDGAFVICESNKGFAGVTHYFDPADLEEPSEIDEMFEEAEKDIENGNFKEIK